LGMTFCIETDGIDEYGESCLKKSVLRGSHLYPSWPRSPTMSGRVEMVAARTIILPARCPTSLSLIKTTNDHKHILCSHSNHGNFTLAG
jgi:hypothetical protein